MKEKNYPNLSISSIIYNQVEDLVSISGIIRGLETNPITTDRPPYSDYTFTVRQPKEPNGFDYAMVNLSLPGYLTGEELGYLTRQGVHSLLQTAQQDQLKTTIYGRSFPDELVARISASRLSILDIEIGRFHTPI